MVESTYSKNTHIIEYALEKPQNHKNIFKLKNIIWIIQKFSLPLFNEIVKAQLQKNFHCYCPMKIYMRKAKYFLTIFYTPLKNLIRLLKNFGFS